ncbi:MAG: molecular chaperone DnaK [Deltaproteobacteria bacterium]|nr:MAG: molecular chaperone DnaK [Deltaproteobacteria bacterium]
MSRIIGIDLGTTNSCVAIHFDGEAVVVANAEGGRTTPSVVAITETGEELVGALARRQAVTNPEATVLAVKRLIGRRYDSPEARDCASVYAYSIVEAPNGDAWVHVRERDYSPQEISSFILRKLKEAAEEYLGEEVTRAIITVPAHFGDSERQATRDAGRLAGLDVERIINEPTAAALAYGVSEEREGLFAVYDLGGGTFDITLLEVRNGVFEVRATSGDTFLGGEDFDNRIIEILVREFQETHGIDLHEERMAMQRLREAAERAKQELSTTTSTEINLPFIAVTDAGPQHLARRLTRGELEDVCAELIERTLGPCQEVLDFAGLTPADMDEVILVGGMTRMPAVQEAVRGFFGRDASRGVNPDEVVAVGAATQGGVLSGEVADVLLLDVTPLSLGVETAGGVFTKLVPQNTTIPVTVAEIFTTAVDNQPFVEVHVLQGERPMAADNRSLARFQLVDLPPAPRGVPKIKVEFHIDANGIVEVTALDEATGKEQRVRVEAASGLTEQEIGRILEEAAASKEDDEERKARADIQNRLRAMLYSVRKSFADLGDRLEEEQRTDIGTMIDESDRILSDEDDVVVLRETLEGLEGAAYLIADAVYAASAEE